MKKTVRATAKKASKRTKRQSRKRLAKVSSFVPRVSWKQFQTYFPPDQHEKLHGWLIKFGRLLAWGGTSQGVNLPLLVTEQKREDPVPGIGELPKGTLGPSPGYNRVVFYCEAYPPVTADEVYGSYPDSDLLPLAPPKNGETFAQWKDRLKEGELDGCGDSLFLFIVRELSESDDVTLDREEALRRLQKGLSDLYAVTEQVGSLWHS